MKRKLIVLLLALVMAFSLVACTNSGNTPSNTSSPSAPASSGTPASPARNPVEISISRSLAPSSLDPHDEDNPMATTATFLIFDRLVAFDNDTNEWLPQVAKSWKQLDDVTWTFDINLDIKFHNGDTLTMDDVVFSIDRMQNFPRSYDNWAMIEKVSYEGSVLTIKFANPYVTTPAKVLAVSYIVNKAYIEAGGDDAIFFKPVATGPYKAVAFTPLTSVTLEAFDDYYYGRPAFDKINFLAIPETDARYIALESGQLQFAGDLNKISYDLAASDANLMGVGNLSKTISCVAFNVKRPPFDNVNVRRALIHALDIEGYAAFDNEMVARSLLYGGYLDMYYEGPDYPEYDLEKAKSMLAAEGFSDSNPLKFELMCVVPHQGQEMWQAALKSIGVDMTLYRPEFGTYISKETGSDYDVLVTGQGNRGNHPVTDLDRFSNDMYGSRNFSLYTSDNVQVLINKIRVARDEQELLGLSRELEDILSYDVPMVGIYCNFTRGAGVKGLTGVTFDGWGRALFRDASMG